VSVELSVIWSLLLNVVKRAPDLHSKGNARNVKLLFTNTSLNKLDVNVLLLRAPNLRRLRSTSLAKDQRRDLVLGLKPDQRRGLDQEAVKEAERDLVSDLPEYKTTDSSLTLWVEQDKCFYYNEKIIIKIK